MARKRPDLRTRAGKAFKRRSDAAKRGWETRRRRQQVVIVEEPIETRGGFKFRKAGMMFQR
jgi:hypothetical protein